MPQFSALFDEALKEAAASGDIIAKAEMFARDYSRSEEARPSPAW